MNDKQLNNFEKEILKAAFDTDFDACAISQAKIGAPLCFRRSQFINAFEQYLQQIKHLKVVERKIEGESYCIKFTCTIKKVRGNYANISINDTCLQLPGKRLYAYLEMIGGHIAYMKIHSSCYNDDYRLSEIKWPVWKKTVDANTFFVKDPKMRDLASAVIFTPKVINRKLTEFDKKVLNSVFEADLEAFRQYQKQIPFLKIVDYKIETRYYHLSFSCSLHKVYDSDIYADIDINDMHIEVMGERLSGSVTCMHGYILYMSISGLLKPDKVDDIDLIGWKGKDRQVIQDPSKRDLTYAIGYIPTYR